MKNAHKFLLSVFVAVFLLMGSATVNYFSENNLNFLGETTASAATYNGTCGDNLTWTLDESSGELVISGTGAMTSYRSYSSVPWYNYKTSIVTVKVSDGVTSIGDYAFDDCTGLISIKIPDSVTSIGGSAIRDCTGLTSITIPDSVTSIGGDAFNGCTGLTSVTIPDSVTSIGDSAFYKTGYYNNASNWEDDVLYINNHLIKAKSSITGSYNIKSGTKTIAGSAFYDCRGLTSITIPDSVTSIGSYAFEWCSSLENVYFTGDVFGWCAISFRGSYSNPIYYTDNFYIGGELVTELVIPVNVTSIGNYAFYGYTGLTSVTIPDSVTSIGYFAFDECILLENVYYTGDVSGWCAISFRGSDSNPMRCADNLYIAGELVTELVIPVNVTSIGNYAFYGYTGLTSVTISDSVTSIGSCAFSGCTGLTSITISDSVTSIGSSSFYNCSGITELTMPISAKIDNTEYTFGGCTNIEKITLTKGNGTVQNYATTTDETTDDTYYKYTPWYISNCAEIIIADDVKDIGKIFYECVNITSVKLGNGIESIADDAFYKCENLTDVIIGNSVTSIGKYAFYRCTGLTSITIPDSVTSIGNYVFYCCSGLERLTIGNKVTSIGYEAFSFCGKLNSVSLPDSVTKIDSNVFSGCKGLVNVTIGKGLSNIATGMFKNCTGLTSITIPDNIISIGDWAFDGCTGLTSMIVSDSVTSIGNYAFEGCTGLTNITIGNNVTFIGSAAFSGCTGLTSIIIPDGVTAIYQYTFSNCTGLTSLTIGNSVSNVDMYAFKGCNGLTELTMPVSVKIDNSKMTFSSCTGLEKITLTKGNGTAQNYTTNDVYGSDTYYQYTPWYISQCPIIVIEEGVQSIGGNMFYNCSEIADIHYTGDIAGWCAISFSNSYSNPMCYGDNLYINGTLVEGEITIPNGVTSIGAYAFYNCSNITAVYYTGDIAGWCAITFGNSYSNPLCYGSTLYINGKLLEGDIVIPYGTTSIGYRAFYSCTGITSVTIPDSVTHIDAEAFYNCTGLIELTMPISTKIYGGANTFGGCIGIKKITLTKGDGTAQNYSTDYGNETYYQYTPWYISQCPTVVIAGDVQYIGSLTFYNCTGLTSITISDSVTSIGNYAFYGCTGLTSVTIPESVTSIGNSAFEDCTGLTNVTIGNSVTSIGSYAFRNCTKLEKVYYTGDIADWCAISFSYDTSNPMYYADNLYIDGELITDLFIPDSVTSIGNYAFYGCTGLTSVTIPDSVTSIGNYAFYHCTGLTSVTISDSVTSIGSYAFYKCSGLASVTIGSGVTSVGAYAFDYCSNITDVYYKGTIADWCAISFSDYDSNPMYYADNLYIGGELVTELVIPDSVTSIGDYAFYNCTGLTSVTIPDSVTSIGEDAFCNCTGITNVYYPGTLDEWKLISVGSDNNCLTDNIIYECNSETPYRGKGTCGDNASWILYTDGELVISGTGQTDSYDNTAYIPWYSKLSKIKTVTVCEGITGIGKGNFYKCSSIVNINLPNSLISIGELAFYNCASLESIEIPANVTTIGNAAFAANPCVTQVLIQDGVTAIGEKQFYNCTGLESVIIPSSVKTIGTDAFTKCTKLSIVYFDGTEYEWSLVEISGWSDPAPTIVYMVQHGDEKDTCAEVVVAQPTCTQSGEKQVTCRCGVTYTEKVYATGHSPELELVEPTCTQEGYEKFICSVCSVEMQNNVLPATGHSYVMEILTQPTCVAEGLAKHTCSSCGDSYEEVIPETGEHTLQTIRKEPTCKAYGTEYYVCTVCGNMIGDTVILPKSDHTYGEWTVEKIPTVTETGSKTHTCTVCDKIETVSIPATDIETAESVTIDLATNTISGFNAGETSLDSYIMVNDNYVWEYETQNGRLGTGSKAILKDGDTVIAEYTILVYGDTNGDSWYDGMDAVLVSCLANGMLTKDDVSEAVYMAADCNHDGVIDEADVALLNEAGTLLANVDQSNPAEILLETSSAYVEYLDLIDQTPEIEVEDENDVETEESPETDAEDSEPIENSIFAFFSEFIAMFQKLFSFILSFVNV